MEKTKRYFFKPYEGYHYKRGLINGKKVLVLGASFYCLVKECSNFEVCTQQWMTNEYDKNCPYNHSGHSLSELPYNELDEQGAISYRKFYRFMSQYLKTRGVEDVTDFYSFWEHVLFTNYIQHEIGGRTITLPSDMSDNDLRALEDVLIEFEPDIVIIWGCVVCSPIKTKDNDEIDLCFKNDFDGSESSKYLFHWQFHGRTITFLNFYHPSSSLFFKEGEEEKMVHYLDQAIGI